MDFSFDGGISREVLNKYFPMPSPGMDNFAPSQPFGDDLRMLKNEGAKFTGRASFVWEATREEEHFRRPVCGPLAQGLLECFAAK